jgi:class 3 adenylate cyclase
MSAGPETEFGREEDVMDPKTNATTRRRGDISAAIAKLIKIPDRIPLKHRRMYSAGLCGSVLAGFTHFIYLFIFLFLDVPVLFYYNIISVMVFIACGILIVRYEAYVAIGIISTSEFIFHQTLAIVLVGWTAGFQYLLLVTIVSPFLLIPNERLRLAAGMSVLSMLAFVFSDLVLRNTVPVYQISKEAISGFDLLTAMVIAPGLLIISFVFVHYVKKAEDKADFEFERAEGLLRNILPDPIAARLKASSASIADGFDCVTVLFADIVDFTVMSEKLSPGEVVSLLNDLFSRFDLVAERRGLEKIKTIGDAYMVASGIPEKSDCTAGPVAEFALDVQEEIRAFNEERGMAIRMRIGINSGPVVAGVIGRKKFIYDLWGDAVNTASRMESHGLPGKIQVTEESHELLKDEYDFEDRGMIEVKGKGRINTFILLGRKAA